MRETDITNKKEGRVNNRTEYVHVHELSHCGPGDAAGEVEGEGGEQVHNAQSGRHVIEAVGLHAQHVSVVVMC